ncbi:MAG: aspartate:alanine exchanger family transporter, partial [Anaerolineaceae bacterium]|nr:aspartate:alanine exchanger family transporter [Anaerolineaceae bacterium]
MIDILLKNPLLLLFIVAAIGYPLGRIKIAGASLGVAAVLFVGLGIGALNPGLKLPDIIITLGQVLFLYTIGLASGSVFFASFLQKGLAHILLALGVLLLGGLLTVLARSFFHFTPGSSVGMFTGSLTSTPAMASVVDYVGAVTPPNLVDQARSEPVVAYSLTYPVGVLGMILTIFFTSRLWKVDLLAEGRALRHLGGSNEPLRNQTVSITNPDISGIPIRDLVTRRRWKVIFGRSRRDGQLTLPTGEHTFAVGDLVNLVGVQDDLDEVTAAIGEPSFEHLEQDLTKYDKRRFFISNPHIAGKRLRDLDLLGRYGAIVTRIRRGDVELLPHGDTVLALGDQIRIVAERDTLERLANLLGDSYRAVSEIDILTFSLGLAIGLLVGLVPIPLPGGLHFSLGVAGGPLIVALILGALGRSGPLVWSLPYSANLTLRQIGLVLFLAGVGTRSGYAFYSTLRSGSGIGLLASGAAITCIVALVALVIGYRLLKIPMTLLMGILSGMQTQTAVLSFAVEQT